MKQNSNLRGAVWDVFTINNVEERRKEKRNKEREAKKKKRRNAKWKQR